MPGRWEASQAFHKHFLPVTQRLLMCACHSRDGHELQLAVIQTCWLSGERVSGSLPSSGSPLSSSAPIPQCRPTTALRGRIALCLNGIQDSSCSRKYLHTLEALSLNYFTLGKQEAVDQQETLLQPPSSEHHVTPSGLCLLVQLQILLDPT